MFAIENLDGFKITKIRDWRINFRYKGVLYSLNSHEDGFEDKVKLTNKSEDEVIVWDYGTLNLRDFIKYKYRSKGLIYSHIDKEFLIEKINAFAMIKERGIEMNLNKNVATMTLDEAIKHCEEIISENNDCVECISKHAQLLVWLEELKELREFKTRIIKAL